CLAENSGTSDDPRFELDCFGAAVPLSLSQIDAIVSCGRSHWRIEEPTVRLDEQTHSMAGVSGCLKARSGQALEEDAGDPQSRLIPARVQTLSPTFAPSVSCVHHETSCWPPSMSYVAPVSAVLLMM